MFFKSVLIDYPQITKDWGFNKILGQLSTRCLKSQTDMLRTERYTLFAVLISF